MVSRMERYQDSSEKENNKSRTQKHKNLYEDFYAKTVYKEIESTLEDVLEDRAVDLNSMEFEKTSRESYHKVKEIEDFMSPRSIQKKSSNLSVFFQEEETPKIYDINTVLESAKKNREEVDELEKRRKLRNDDYNIIEILAKQPERNNESLNQDSRVELAELIHTITSRPIQEDNTLSKKLGSENLLNNLMPNNIDETVISEDLSKAILAKEIEEIKPQKKEPEVDRSFYTRSMDLSDTDFDEMETDEFIEKPRPFITFVKVFIAVLLVISLAVGAFYLMSGL